MRSGCLITLDQLSVLVALRYFTKLHLLLSSAISRGLLGTKTFKICHQSSLRKNLTLILAILRSDLTPTRQRSWCHYWWPSVRKVRTAATLLTLRLSSKLFHGLERRWAWLVTRFNLKYSPLILRSSLLSRWRNVTWFSNLVAVHFCFDRLFVSVSRLDWSFA